MFVIKKYTYNNCIGNYALRFGDVRSSTQLSGEPLEVIGSLNCTSDANAISDCHIVHKYTWMPYTEPPTTVEHVVLTCA